MKLWGWRAVGSSTGAGETGSTWKGRASPWMKRVLPSDVISTGSSRSTVIDAPCTVNGARTSVRSAPRAPTVSMNIPSTNRQVTGSSRPSPPTFAAHSAEKGASAPSVGAGAPHPASTPDDRTAESTAKQSAGERGEAWRREVDSIRGFMSMCLSGRCRAQAPLRGREDASLLGSRGRRAHRSGRARPRTQTAPPRPEYASVDGSLAHLQRHRQPGLAASALSRAPDLDRDRPLGELRVGLHELSVTGEDRLARAEHVQVHEERAE